MKNLESQMFPERALKTRPKFKKKIILGGTAPLWSTLKKKGTFQELVKPVNFEDKIKNEMP